MSEDEMRKEENLEHEVLDRLKTLEPIDFDYNVVDGSYVDAMLKARNIILDLYKQEKEKNKDNNEKIKYAAKQIAALNRDNTKILAGKDKEEKLNYKYFDFKPIECQEYKSEKYIQENYISKDKIKEKMKIIENECKTCKYNHILCEERKPLANSIKYCLKLEYYDFLKSLLEEN